VQVTSAEFVTSAADARGVPRDADQIALVGRSNVGKSTLINALLRQRLARTSAAAGKTRLLNFYRVTFDPFAPVKSLYLVDLPGYGYARGGQTTKEGFATLLESYFGGATRPAAVLHLVDARHPGLPQDVAAWDWIRSLTHASRPDDTRDAHDPPLAAAVVATKIDKLSRAERRRALETWTRQLNAPVLPVSAVTGEGMTDLWTLIVRLLRPQPPAPPRPTSGASATSSAPSGPTGPSAPSEASGAIAGPAPSGTSDTTARTERTARTAPNARTETSGPTADRTRRRRRRGRS
jgi:GTP-binding protein